MDYIVEDAIRQRGIKVCLVEAKKLNLMLRVNRLEVLKKIIGAHIMQLEESYKQSNDIWQDYQQIYEAIDPSYAAFMPSSKYFIYHFLKKPVFGSGNPLLDICNLVSAMSLLSVVAHSQHQIEGYFRIGVTSGKEVFIPMGSSRRNYIGPGEYAHMDKNQVICRMDVRPAQKTKVTLETHHTLIAIHGNRVTSDRYVLDAAQQIMDLIEEFCGGECQLVKEKNTINPS